MRTIHIDYQAVNEQTAKLRRQQAEMVNEVRTHYRNIQNELRGVDGSANAQLIEAMEINCQKAIAASGILDRLLMFMSSASRQVESSEMLIAQAFTATRR